MRKIFATLLALTILSPLAILAQGVSSSPVEWTNSIEFTSPTEGHIDFTATIEAGYHLYSTTFREGGPTPTEIQIKTISGAELNGDMKWDIEPTKKFDKFFNLELDWWADNVTLSVPFKLLEGSHTIKVDGVIRFMACNNQNCITPQKVKFDLTQVAPGYSGPAENPEPVKIQPTEKPSQPTSEAKPQFHDPASWWKPVAMKHAQQQPSTWWHILIWGFIGGLLALLTPCVWPLIPMTVSFFLKKTTSRRRSITDAIIYGVAIVVIYLTLGLLITGIFGAGKLNDLATNSVFNIIFFLILVVFAISFFGAFDIKLPSRWSNSVDSKAERTTGIVSIFFMAFTLVLVSFSCTGPLIGTLLVEAASQGNITGPALGMGAFALALAIPFALFAIFPSMLKEMPRSGGWLNSVKVVLGFLELVLSLKFLSVADLAYGWGILDREVFLSLWIVLFILLGMYLLGKLRFSHDAPLDYVSTPRFFLALASLSFAVYLIPGLWGAPLKAVSAFAPPLYTQDFNLYSIEQKNHFTDYDQGMAFAAENGLPVLVDFSGHGCVNCRKMEGAVFDNSEVKKIIADNFVFITLMVDEKKELSKPFTVVENGKTIEIETVGEKWAYLQQHKFGAISQPYYVILDNDGVPMGPSYAYDESVPKFIDWLNSGLVNYHNTVSQQ